MSKVTSQPVPKTWSDSPKGCWSAHPLSREVCQLEPNGHKVHQRLHANGQELECWRDAKDAGTPKPVRRWALWSKDLQKFYTPLPHETEQLYDSRGAAVAGRLSGSHYGYKPVRVKLVPETK